MVKAMTVYLIIKICFPNLFLNVMNSFAWFEPEVLYYWRITNGVLIILSK